MAPFMEFIIPLTALSAIITSYMYIAVNMLPLNHDSKICISSVNILPSGMKLACFGEQACLYTEANARTCLIL